MTTPDNILEAMYRAASGGESSQGELNNLMASVSKANAFATALKSLYTARLIYAILIRVSFVASLWTFAFGLTAWYISVILLVLVFLSFLTYGISGLKTQ